MDVLAIRAITGGFRALIQRVVPSVCEAGGGVVTQGCSENVLVAGGADGGITFLNRSNLLDSGEKSK